MISRKTAYEFLIKLSEVELLQFASDVITYHKLPKDEHTPIVYYQYTTCEEFTERCNSFNVDSTVTGIKDVHWIKPILSTLSNNQEHFVIKNADMVCITFHGLEIVQFKNTSNCTKSHRSIIEYERIQSKINEEVKKQPSYVENFVYFSGITFLTICIGFTTYSTIKRLL